MPEEPRDPSVLGNLPRSRPGRRSEKRSGAAKPAAPRVSRTASSSTRAKPKAKAKAAQAKRAAPTKARGASKPAAARPPRTAPARSRPSDPVSSAVRFAGQVAGAGVKVAGEVLKRLPGR